MTDLSPAALGRAIHDKRRRLFPGVTDLHNLPAGLDTAAYLIDELIDARIAQGDYANVTLMNHLTPNPDFAFIAEGIRKTRQTAAFARPGTTPPTTQEVNARTPAGTQVRITGTADQLNAIALPLRYQDAIGTITITGDTGVDVRMAVDDRIWWLPFRDVTVLNPMPNDAVIDLAWHAGDRVRMIRDADNTFDVGPEALPANATGTLVEINNAYGPGWAVDWDDFDHYVVPDAFMELIP